MWVHAVPPLAAVGLLRRRPAAQGQLEDAWAVFSSSLRPPYDVQSCLAGALEAVARLLPADAYYGYAADRPGGALILRVTRAPSGQPTVGPDYAGLVTGGELRPVPLELAPREAAGAELAVVDGELVATLTVSPAVVLRAALPVPQRRQAERLLAVCTQLAARLRPVLDVVLFRPPAGPAVPSAAGGPDALLLTLPAERTLDLLCRVGAQALGATDGYLALWREAAPEVPVLRWSVGNAGPLLEACPPGRLRACLRPPRVAGWRLPRLPGGLEDLGYSGFVCIPLQAGEGAGGVLALAQTQAPLAPPAVAGRLAKVVSALLREDERAEYLAQGRLETLLGIGDLLESCDAHLAGHSVKVARAAEGIARQMGLTPTEREATRLAGRLHDLGMVGVGLELPLRRGPLTDAERERARQHPLIAADLLRSLPASVVPAEVVLAVRHHHERWDGRGYPDGLAGEAIPALARILACAEVMVAQMSPRNYRAALGTEQALRYLAQASGVEFDPRVVVAAQEVFARGLP